MQAGGSGIDDKAELLPAKILVRCGNNVPPVREAESREPQTQPLMPAN